MRRQNYKNHARYYAPHHFMLLPLLLIAIVISAYHIFSSPFQQVIYIWITVVLLFMFWMAIMLRQHYSLNNQNRIVRLEMRLRYYQLTNNKFEPLERLLTFEQIAALRFAPDEELLALIEHAVNEKLSPKDIKQSIRNWQPDYMRV
jgi:c-di-AMP phosphodiesterase-like protein